MSKILVSIALACATITAISIARPSVVLAQGSGGEAARGESLEASADSKVDPQAEQPDKDQSPEEVIVIFARERAQGSEDLRGPESEHANAERGLKQPVFATLVHVRDSEGERRTVSEVLARTVGVSSRSLGGLAAFSSISVRGADASHTTVLVDGVPLSRIASATANLSQFELGSFDRVELFRGGVPLELGGSGVGGALNMQTALGRTPGGEALQLSAGMGSYGARHMRARWLGGSRGGARAYQLSAGYAHAKGDFSFFDDGGTPLNRSDDKISIRRNNGFDRIDLMGRARWGRWTVGSRSSVLDQGLPGAAHNQALSTRLHTAHEIVDARYQREGLVSSGDSAHLRSFVSVERQRFSDPESEIGLLAQDSVYLTTSGGLGAGYILDLGEHQRLALDVDSRLDWFRERPQGNSMQLGARGNRQALALSVSDQLRFQNGALLVDLGVRGEALRTRPGADVFAPSPARSGPVQNDAYLSPRAALRYRLTESLAIKSSGGRYLRTPTLLEMFGDRGVILGNSELVAEVGLSGDAGLVWAPAPARGPVDRIYVEAVGFASRPDKPIVFVSRNGLAAQAINLEGAQIFGAELVGSLRAMQRVTVTTNYSFLDARNRGPGSVNNKQLPGRARHRFYARADTAFSPAGRLLVVWSDVLRLSGNYLDELNVLELPARSLVGVGIKAKVFDALLLGVEVKNLADLRSESVALDPPPSEDFQETPKALSDVHGYPLPGRSFFLTLQWSR